MITCSELSVPPILCVQCLLRNVDAKCMWSCKWIDTFECLKWGNDRGCWCRNIDIKGNSMFFWCGPYKIPEVLNKDKNIKLDIPVPSDGMRVFNRDSIKPYIHRERQPLWVFPKPNVKTGNSPRLVKILGRRREGPKKCRTFLYRCEWDDHTWSLEPSKAVEEDPVHLEFLRLHPE